MAEQYSPFHEFDACCAGEALGAEPRATRDVAHGNGSALTVGPTELEVYHLDGVVRATTQDARVELFRVPRYAVDEEGQRVLFEQQSETTRARMQVRRDGRVSFYPIATDAAPVQPATTDRQSPVPSTSRPAEATTAPSERSSNGSPAPEQTEAPQIQLTGRLGRDPWHKTDDDQLVAGFPVAVNTAEKTIWHNVVTFDELAEDVVAQAQRGDLKKGRLVDVTGRSVQVEQTTPGGKVRRVTEFHASAVVRQTTTRVRRPAP